MTFLKTVSSIFILLLIISCKSRSFGLFNPDDAKLSLFKSANKKAFSFVVSEDFIRNNSKSKPSSIYPKMSTDEMKLLMKLLNQNKYCINSNDDLSFKITSKQEKVYDVTFSSLIEQSYNAKPVSPVTYFGECL